MFRISTVIAAAFATLAVMQLGGAKSHAETFPGKPITLIAPFPPGAATDILARIIQPKMAEKLGQPVVVANPGGAGGSIGTARLARSPADGYTILVTVNAPIVMAPFLQADISYDPAKDLRGIGLVAESYFTLVVRADSELKSVEDLIAKAKANPGAMKFASAGIGSAHHIAGELLNKNAGINIVHVPYPGGAPAIQDVVGGHVEIGMGLLPSVHSFVQNGDLKILALIERKPVASQPGLPLLKDIVPGVETASWFGMFTPKGTPDDIVAKLSEALTFALADTATREAIEKLGMTPLGGTPDEMDQLVVEELEFWKHAIELAGIKKQ